MQEHWRGGGFDNGKKKVVFCQWEVHLELVSLVFWVQVQVQITPQIVYKM